MSNTAQSGASMGIITKDTIVVGLGAWGSAALWRLAARGIDVAGIERYSIVHELGSTHGTTRVFRVACKEHVGLSPIALKSLELWKRLGQQNREVYVKQTGCLSVGRQNGEAVSGAVRAAQAAGTSLEHLSHDEVIRRYPAYRTIGPDDVGVLDTQAGVCYPERFVAGQVAEARRLGAQVYAHTMITRIVPQEDYLVLHTPTVTFHAKHVVLAVGSWLGKFIEGLPLRPRRVPLFWFKAKGGHGSDFALNRFPCFIRDLPEDAANSGGNVLWGHGSAEEFGIKIGASDLAPFIHDTDADAIDRYIHDSDIAPLSHLVERAFPEVEPNPVKVIPCITTETPDSQFIVGALQSEPRIVIAGGDSFHGAKHAAGLGELIAQIVTDEPQYTEIEFMNPERFTQHARLRRDMIE